MKTIQKFLLIFPCALAILVACGKNPTPDPTPDPIPDPTLAARAFEATFDAGSNTAYGQQNKVVIAESSVTFGTATFTDTTDIITNTRYLKAVFPVTNNSASVMTNLTLYTFNRASANIGGTGMRTLTNFVGTTSSSDAAQAIKPTHGMTNSSTVTSGQEDFQAFQLSELSSIKSTAITNGAMTNSDTVLEYGYVARYCTANCSGANPTWSRSIPAGQTGQVTIAYKLPNASVNTAYKFIATFVLSTQSTTRVTRSREETTATAQTRATALGATEVVLIGSDKNTSSVGKTIRLSNIKTSTNPNYLYPAFNITLQYSNNVPNSFKADIQYAVNRWEDIIIADVSNYTGLVTPTYCGYTSIIPGWSNVSSVDDILIYVDAGALVGAAGLGSTCLVRNDGLLPVNGVIEINSSALKPGNSETRQVIMHELGHALGLGPLWSALGFVEGDATPFGCDTTYYTGANAKAEWNKFGGSGNIPLETGGGLGTCEVHWKSSNFGRELMASTGGAAVSRITIGSLKDIGYTVNYAFADAYTPLSLVQNLLTVQQARHLGEKLFIKPIVVK